MATIVNGICKAISCVFDIADTATMMRSFDYETTFGTATVAARIFAVAANIGESGAKLCGASNKSLGAIKSTECIAQFGELYLQCKNLPFQTTMTDMLKRICGSVAALARINNELSVYQEKAYLSMTPEERAKQVRYERIYIDENHSEEKFSPVTEKDCKVRLQNCEKWIPICSTIETLVKADVGTLVVHGPESLLSSATYKQLGSWLSALAQQFGRGGDRGQFDLLALSMIPEELHEDPVFAANICPITLCPIRHPVGDPNGITIYEREAIIEAINLRHRSPMTQAPLEIRDLIQQPALQATIDARLRFHEDRLRREMA